MRTPIPSIKRHNHRIHPCEPEQKAKLLAHLIAKHAGEDILIVTAKAPSEIVGIEPGEHLVIIDDTGLAASPELTCDLLISHDLPDDAALYMARLARTRANAVILLSKAEQTVLYPIEMALGRNIMQEVIVGFEPTSQTPIKAKGPRQQTRSKERRPQKNAKRVYDKDADDKARHRSKKTAGKSHSNRDEKPRSDKGKKPSRYIGKDENGKPMFSGKTGERNHHYDGRPKEAPSDQSDKKHGSKDPVKKSAKMKGSFDKPKKQSEKKQDRPYDKDDKSKSKPSDKGTRSSAPKRPKRTFRVKATKPSS